MRGSANVADLRARVHMMDELWSFVGKKGNQRWQWHAIDHSPGASWRMSLAAAKTTFCSSSKRSWSLLDSPAFTPLIGARTHAIWLLTRTAQAHGTPKRSS